MNNLTKITLSILLGIGITVFAVLYLKSCGSEKVKTVTKFTVGKSWSVTKPNLEPVHFNRAVESPKPIKVYFPVHIHHYYNDSTRWKSIVDSLRNLLAIRVYLDSQKIGKATIYSNDSVQGTLLRKQIGCLNCGYDTTFSYRVDTLDRTIEKVAPKSSIGGQVGIYFGWNWCPIPFVYFGPGVGAGYNYQLLPKSKK